MKAINPVGFKTSGFCTPQTQEIGLIAKQHSFSGGWGICIAWPMVHSEGV